MLQFLSRSRVEECKLLRKLTEDSQKLGADQLSSTLKLKDVYDFRFVYV